jgi:hypothetical protein
MPQVRDIEPQQHGNKGPRDAKTDGDLRDIKADKLGHLTTPLLTG